MLRFETILIMASSLSLHVDAEKLRVLNSKITKCALCPRLLEYVRQVGQDKVRRFAGEEYWARPAPSWGDPNARLLIVGLAPAAHRGNRKGSMFTGGRSGEWHPTAAQEAAFANRATSRSHND